MTQANTSSDEIYGTPIAASREAFSLPPPPPPPPPPPMPCDQMNLSTSRLDTSISGLDLVNPVANIRPHMKMRTLNWHRIPKRQVLSKVAESCPLELSEKRTARRARSRRQTIGFVDEQTPTHHETFSSLIGVASSSASEDERAASDDDDDENTNIWFLIAKNNKAVKRVESNSSQHTSQNLSSQQDSTIEDNDKTPQLEQPISSTSRKSALRIRQMLESVRRRMAAVSSRDAAQAQQQEDQAHSLSQYQSIGDLSNSSFLSSSSFRLARNHARKQNRSKSVIEALDFHYLESLFCLNNQPLDDDSNSSFVRRASWRTNISSDSVISSMNSYDSNHHLNDESAEGDDLSDSNENSIDLVSGNILDSKKSLNVNIFMKQLKNQAEFISLIDKCDNSKLDNDKLENLLKLLPSESDQAQLMKFHWRNKRERLPPAERFLLDLITRVPNLVLKIKFMLLREKYVTDIESQVPQELDKLEEAVREIRKSKKLRDLLNLVLVTGNFLNTGGYAADAVGFTLDCLERLQEVRSNQDGICLIHYLAEVAQTMHLLDFQQSELAHVDSASRVCLDTIKQDLATMSAKVEELNEAIEKATQAASASSQKQVTPMKPKRRNLNSAKSDESSASEQREFLLNLSRTLEDIKCNVGSLKRRLTVDLDQTRRRLADYLCEDPSSFNLHDCFRRILTFSQRLKAASEENERRERLELSRATNKTSSSLRRSNTINARLPKTTNASVLNRDRKSLGCTTVQQPAYLVPFDKTRASFGGMMSSRADERRSQVGCLTRQFGDLHVGGTPSVSNLRRASSNCSSFIKSSLSSLSSQATLNSNSTTSSSMNNSGEGDELHDGLMRLLNDSNYRRYSDIHRGQQAHFAASSAVQSNDQPLMNRRGSLVAQRRRLFNQ